MIPDHAALPVAELRRRLWHSRLDALNPDDALARVSCFAMEAADDAAREMLELTALPPVVKLHPDFWEYWKKILGAYDSTIPTGTRTGKRWCRTGNGGRFICEYTENSIVWYPVELTES